MEVLNVAGGVTGVSVGGKPIVGESGLRAEVEKVVGSMPLNEGFMSSTSCANDDRGNVDDKNNRGEGSEAP